MSSLKDKIYSVCSVCVSRGDEGFGYRTCEAV